MLADGRQERVPSTATARFAGPSIPRAPWRDEAVVALVPGDEPYVAAIVTSLQMKVEFVSAIPQLIARIESACPQTLVFDAEALGWPATLSLLVRSLRPEAFMVAVLHHWSEREESMREWVDAVLHKPPRLYEWAALFGAPPAA